MPEQRLLLVLAAGMLGLAAGVAGAALVLRRARVGATPIDVPDDRRLHTRPTPRGGGIGLCIGGALAAPLAALAAGSDADRRAVLLITLGWALPNGLLGWLDDYRPMRSRVKFAFQVTVAATAVALGLRLDALAIPPLGELGLGWAAYPVTTLWLVWMANVYNFMDGMDALAAGSGLVYLCGLGVLAGLAHAWGLVAVAASMGAACVGFLRYNLPPARVFMGDGGSLFCGAVLGGMPVALAGSSIGDVPIAASVILLGTFVWDASYTIARRALRGDPMLPHRTHLFQRLALAGWSHARVRGIYLVLAAAFTAAGTWMPRAQRPAQGVILTLALTAGIALVVVTHVVEKRNKSL